MINQTCVAKRGPIAREHRRIEADAGRLRLGTARIRLQRTLTPVDDMVKIARRAAASGRNRGVREDLGGSTMAVDEPCRGVARGNCCVGWDEDLKMSSGKVAVFPGPDGRSWSGCL